MGAVRRRGGGGGNGDPAGMKRMGGRGLKGRLLGEIIHLSLQHILHFIFSIIHIYYLGPGVAWRVDSLNIYIHRLSRYI